MTTQFEKGDEGKIAGLCPCGNRMRVTKVTENMVKKECGKCSMTHENNR